MGSRATSRITIEAKHNERKCYVRVSVKVIGYILQQHLEMYLYLKASIDVALSLEWRELERLTCLATASKKKLVS